MTELKRNPLIAVLSIITIMIFTLPLTGCGKSVNAQSESVISNSSGTASEFQVESGSNDSENIENISVTENADGTFTYRFLDQDWTIHLDIESLFRNGEVKYGDLQNKILGESPDGIIMDYTMYSDRDVCNGISLTSYGHGDPLDLKISVPFKDTAKSYTVTVNGYSVSSMEFSLEQLVLAACGGEAFVNGKQDEFMSKLEPFMKSQSETSFLGFDDVVYKGIKYKYILPEVPVK